MFMSPEATSKKKHLFRMAKLAEGAKRYEHMVRFMKEIVQITHPDQDISPKERCLLGAAFKNSVAQAREALRLATTITLSWHGTVAAPVAASYLRTSRVGIIKICEEIIEIIDRRLFPSAVAKESKIYYLTLKGDFSWYLAEVKGQAGGNSDEAAAKSAFMDAAELAKDLDKMSPYRLALQYSLVCFKFSDDPLDAITALNKALKTPAINEPETLPLFSLLSFEGGFQMLANLITMKQMILEQEDNSAGPSHIPAGDVAGHR